MELPTDLGQLGTRFLERPHDQRIRLPIPGFGESAHTPIVRGGDAQQRLTDLTQGGFVLLLVRRRGEVGEEPVHDRKATSAV